MIGEFAKAQVVRPGTAISGPNASTGQWENKTYNPKIPEGMQPDASGNAVDVPGAAGGYFRQALRAPMAAAETTLQPSVDESGAAQVTPGRTKGSLLPQGLRDTVQGTPPASVSWSGGNVPGVGNLPAGQYTGATARAINRAAGDGRGGAPLPQSATTDSQGNSAPGAPIKTALGPGDAELLKGNAEQDKTRATEIYARGALGNQQVARFSELSNLLTTFDPNIGAPWRLKAARIADGLGFSKDQQSAIAGGSPGAMIAFNKLGFEGALQLLKSYTPRFTQNEVTQTLENNQNIALTKEGNQLVLATGMAAAKYNAVMAAELAQAKVDNPLVNAAQWEQQYYQKNPPENFLPSMDQINAILKNGTPLNLEQGAAVQSAGMPQSRYKSGVVVQLPDGKFKDFVNQRYADQFKAAAGLQ